MRKIKNPLQFWEHTSKAKEHLENVENRFAPKSFYDDFLQLYQVANISRLFLPIISIGTGLLSVALAFQQVLPWWPLCLLLACFFLTVWERSKVLTVAKTFELFYTRSRLVWLALVAMLFSVGSVFFSLHGTREAANMMDTVSHDVAQAYQVKKDSIQAMHDALVSKARQDANQYYRANSWKGTITYAKDNRFADAYRKLQEHVTDQERAKALALAALDLEEHAELTKRQGEKAFNVWAALLVVALVELAILFANWFLVFFDWKVYREAALVRENLEAGTFTITSHELTNLLRNLWHIPSMPKTLSPPNGSPAIGFQVGKQETSANQVKAEPMHNAMRNAMRSGKKLGNCETCGAEFEKRTTWQKYCSEVCRVQAWEERTGKKLHKP